MFIHSFAPVHTFHIALPTPNLSVYILHIHRLSLYNLHLRNLPEYRSYYHQYYHPLFLLNNTTYAVPLFTISLNTNTTYKVHYYHHNQLLTCPYLSLCIPVCASTSAHSIYVLTLPEGALSLPILPLHAHLQHTLTGTRAPSWTPAIGRCPVHVPATGHCPGCKFHLYIL